MKHKFSLIWRVAVALVLVLSFSLVAAVPVTAEPDVSDVWVQLTGTTPYDADQTDVTYNVYFTPGADLAKNVDTVSVLFPSAVGGTIGASDVKVDPDGDGVTKTGVSATAVTSASTSSLVVCTISVDLEAGTEALISIAKVTNPTAAGAKTLKVKTSQETTWVESMSYVIGAGLVTTVGFTPVPLTAGSAAEYTISFVSIRALVADLDTITVVFPTGTTVPSSVALTHVTVEDTTAVWGPTAPTSVAATVLGRFVTLTVPDDVVAGDTVEVVFDATSGIYNGTLATDTNGADGIQNNLLHLEDYVGKVYTNRDTAIVSDSSFYLIAPAAAISKLAFGATLTDHTSAALVEKDKVSGFIYVQTQDQYSNLTLAGSDLSVTLSSDTTGTATFSTNPVVIGGSACEASFKYQDTAAGTWTITASPPSGSTIAAATWEIKVEEAHVIALYDATGGLVDDTYTTIQAAITDALTGFTVKVGPGTYTPSSALTIDKEGLTLKSTDGAAVTIIDATNAGANAITVTVDDVTVDGFTIDNAVRGVQLQASCKDGTVKNCIFTDGSSIAVNLGSQTTGATVTDNIMDGCHCGVYFDSSDENTVSDNVITGSTGSTEGAISFFGLSDDNTITRNTITGNEGSGIFFFDSTVCDGNLISGNTISANEVHGIDIATNTAPTNLTITGNDITDNEGVGILVGSWTAASDAIKFNNITGNDTTNGYGLQNSSGGTVDATHNWWGTTVSSEIAAMINNTDVSTTAYDPWLGASVSVAKFAPGATSLLAETTVGVKVSGVASKDIGVARYTENPATEPSFTVMEDGYFDVYVNDSAASSTEIGIRFYDAAITSDSVAYVWDAFEEMWKPCSDQNPSSGMVWVKVRPIGTTATTPTIEDLAGTPFAISVEEAPPEDILAYYRAYSGDPLVVETTDLLKAANDWANAVVPPGFTEPISTTQLLTLANEWAATE